MGGNATTGNGGEILIAAGVGPGQDGNITFNTSAVDHWRIEQQTGDPDYGTSALLKVITNSGIIEGTDGAPGFDNPGDDVIIRGGFGGGEGFGGDVILTGGTGGTDSGTEPNAGNVLIGTYLVDAGGHTNNIGTLSVTIGAEANPTQTVEIFNFSSPTMQVGPGNDTTQPLLVLQNGYTSLGTDTVAAMNIGPVYYDPNNGQIIRMGNTLACIYLEGDATDNTVRGGDGGDILNLTLFTLPFGPETYDLADNSIAPPSPIEPGSVTIRVILDGNSTFSETTDDGAGAFPVSAVLPAGGTINYTTGDLTGITAVLDTKTQVVALYSRANEDGEPLTPRAGNGVGTGNGGELRLRGGVGGNTNGNGGGITIFAGAGGGTGAGGPAELYGGDGGPTSGNGGNAIVGGGYTTDGVGGNIVIEGGQSGGTDQPGAPIELKTGLGTGSGNPGSLLLRTSTILASGTTLQTPIDRIYINGVRKTLTDNTPVNLFEVAITAGQMAGGYVTYNIRASDGTDFQARSGTTYFSGVNKAGTVTTSATAGTTDVSVSAGTLAQTWASTAGTNKFTVSLNADSSLTTTVLDVMYTVHLDATQLITIL